MSDYIVQVQNLNIVPSPNGTINCNLAMIQYIYFKEDSTFTYTGPNDLTDVEIPYLVGGGGAGGLTIPDKQWGSGGGGGGEMATATAITLSRNDKYTLTIGAGGAATSSTTGNGETSMITINDGTPFLQAYGGGRGGDNNGTANCNTTVYGSGGGTSGSKQNSTYAAPGITHTENTSTTEYYASIGGDGTLTWSPEGDKYIAAGGGGGGGAADANGERVGNPTAGGGGYALGWAGGGGGLGRQWYDGITYSRGGHGQGRGKGLNPSPKFGAANTGNGGDGFGAETSGNKYLPTYGGSGIIVLKIPNYSIILYPNNTR